MICLFIFIIVNVKDFDLRILLVFYIDIWEINKRNNFFLIYFEVGRNCSFLSENKEYISILFVLTL